MVSTLDLLYGPDKLLWILNFCKVRDWSTCQYEAVTEYEANHTARCCYK